MTFVLPKRQPTIAVDENILGASSMASSNAKVHVFDPDKLGCDELNKVDALIVRSVTKVNSDLLGGTKVRFVGSATSGVDHLDVNCLNERRIAWAYAPGSNALAVSEYVLAGIVDHARKHRRRLADMTIAVVGCGHVGSLVVGKCNVLGMPVVCVDPFLARRGKANPTIYHDSTDVALNADVITLHVPLTDGGAHPTKLFVGQQFFSKLTKKPLFINTSRGQVIDEEALLTALEKNLLSEAILDVWSDEPSISLSLYNSVLYATPHIAGYGWLGKRQATKAVVDQLNAWAVSEGFLGVSMAFPPLQAKAIQLPEDRTKEDIEGMLKFVISKTYSIGSDHRNFRQMVRAAKTPIEVQQAFGAFRRNYKNRLEWPFWRIDKGKRFPTTLERPYKQLLGLGFAPTKVVRKNGKPSSASSKAF